MEVARRPFTARVKKDSLAVVMQVKRIEPKEVAKRAGIHRQTIWNLTSGYRKTCNPETASKISAALDVDFDSIFLLESLHSEQNQMKQAA